MPQTIKHWHTGDYRLIALLLLTALMIALFLTQQSAENARTAHSWRKVELTLVKQRLDSGDLSYQEASWYHPATPEELTDTGVP